MAPLKPTFDGAHARGLPAGGRDLGVQHRQVGRHPGDSHLAALQVTRRGEMLGGERDEPTERALGDCHDRLGVPAGIDELGDVQAVGEAELGTAGVDQLQRVAGAGGLHDPQRDVLALVVAGGERPVDPGVHGVGHEVQDERDRGALRQRRRAQGHGRCRGDPGSAAGRAAAAGQGDGEREPAQRPRHGTTRSSGAAVRPVPWAASAGAGEAHLSSTTGRSAVRSCTAVCGPWRVLVMWPDASMATVTGSAETDLIP